MKIADARNFDTATLAENFFNCRVSDAGSVSGTSEEMKNGSDELHSLSDDDYRIPLNFVWTRMKVGTTFECTVTEVCNPRNFWIQSQKFGNLFDSLVNEMT